MILFLFNWKRLTPIYLDQHRQLGRPCSSPSSTSSLSSPRQYPHPRPPDLVHFNHFRPPGQRSRTCSHSLAQAGDLWGGGSIPSTTQGFLVGLSHLATPQLALGGSLSEKRLTKRQWLHITSLEVLFFHSHSFG